MEDFVISRVSPHSWRGFSPLQDCFLPRHTASGKISKEIVLAGAVRMTEGTSDSHCVEEFLVWPFCVSRVLPNVPLTRQEVRASKHEHRLVFLTPPLPNTANLERASRVPL